MVLNYDKTIGARGNGGGRDIYLYTLALLLLRVPHNA